jgi:hypothetical protein
MISYLSAGDSTASPSKEQKDFNPMESTDFMKMTVSDIP